MGYTFRLTARVLLYASSHRQDNTYHSLFTPVVEHWLEQEIYIHTYIHTHIHTHIYTYIHTCMHTYTHTYI